MRRIQEGRPERSIHACGIKGSEPEELCTPAAKYTVYLAKQALTNRVRHSEGSEGWGRGRKWL